VADGVFLRFEDPYGTGKRYARLPAGEYGYSDAQGLYEWRRVPYDWPEGSVLPGPGYMLVRIDHSGGDRQASDRNGFWTHGGSGSLQGRGIGYPAELGLQAAVDPARMN
jgi:hypothetical protein